MTFEEWVNKQEKNGLSELSNAWFDLAQEFQSGSASDQFRVLEQIMKRAWDARYNTLTYHDL